MNKDQSIEQKTAGELLNPNLSLRSARSAKNLPKEEVCITKKTFQVAVDVFTVRGVVLALAMKLISTATGISPITKIIIKRTESLQTKAVLRGVQKRHPQL